MAVLKTKTVSVGDQKQRIQLKKKVNGMSRGGKHMYTIEDADTGSLLEDPFTNKRDAEREFQQAVEHIRSGMQSAMDDTGRGFLGSAPEIDVPESDSDDKLFDPFDDDKLL